MPTTITEQDRIYLQRALELAEGGRGRVSPNPLVGAVLVGDGVVVGEGFHAVYGERHAEVAAIADCLARGHSPGGATLYVTLEPCAHQGKQPPCVAAIVAAGIARVVIGSDDPSEKAMGRGPGILRDEGVGVEMAAGAEAAAARLLNQPFRKHARTGRPLVVYKAAMSLDGKLATPSGDSQWISGESSRALVHGWRGECDAVAVGIGTALADDPLLTARPEKGAVRQPVRIVFDSQARLPLESQLVATARQVPLLVVVAPDAPHERIEALAKAGVEIVVAPGGNDSARALAALTILGSRGLTSVMLEGGPGLAGAFFDAGELDELRLFLAPVVVGGSEAPGVLGGSGVERIADAVRPLAMDLRAVEQDLLMAARLREW